MTISDVTRIYFAELDKMRSSSAAKRFGENYIAYCQKRFECDHPYDERVYNWIAPHDFVEKFIGNILDQWDVESRKRRFFIDH